MAVSTKMHHIKEVKPLPSFRIWIKFSDRVEGIVDLSDLAGKGVFSKWNDKKYFNSVWADLQMKRTKNILICGRPGVGKTTLIKKVVKNLGKKAAGFYTEEIRKERKRVGFKIKNLEEEERTLAHINCKSPYRVGKYKVNLREFEEIAIPSIKKGIKEGKIIIIDEIGKMELYSNEFRRMVIQALDSPNIVIATIPTYKNEFLEKIRQREDIEIHEITREDREKLWHYLIKKIKNPP